MDVPPLVIVEGFLGARVTALWGSFEEHMNWNYSAGGEKRKTIFVGVGPVSSLHDRACELYYALAGGTVDYGEQHASANNHARYGRTHHTGLYPQWSRQHPLHFFGHSMGGVTIVKLQHLIQIGHFGPDAHPDMIRSITTVSSPFRGTQLVYTLGERLDSAPSVRTWSVGSFLAQAIHTLAYFSPILPPALDVHAESRSLSFRESSFFGFLKQLWPGKSEWATSRDATPFDVTFQAADEREGLEEGKVHSETFYRSFVTSMTKKVPNSPYAHHLPSLSQMLSPSYYLARAIGTFDFSKIKPTPSFLPVSTSASHHHIEEEAGPLEDSRPTVELERLDEAHWENDGVVPTFSQWHPHPCKYTKCIHLPIDKATPPLPTPGVWWVSAVYESSHSSLVPIWMGTMRQRVFWGQVGDWLYRIDTLCSNKRHER